MSKLVSSPVKGDYLEDESLVQLAPGSLGSGPAVVCTCMCLCVCVCVCVCVCAAHTPSAGTVGL